MAKIDRQYRHAIGQQMGTLARCIPQRQAEQLLLDALARMNDLDDRLVATMQLLPRPWSSNFAGAVLRQARDRMRDLGAKGSAIYYNEPWLVLLPHVAVAIPPASFGEALAIQSALSKDEQPAPSEWWQRRIADFGDLVHSRQRLMKEIPL